jgi:hypothetical protein
VARSGGGSSADALLRPQLAAVHPGLVWSVTAGQPARLTVSGGGRLELRGVAERWLLSAPPADDVVRFAAAEERDLQALQGVAEVFGYDVDLGEVVASARVDRRSRRVDVAVHHHLFPLLPDDERATLALLVLRLALGEDDAERRLGAVDVAVDEPRDAFPVAALGDVVDQLAAAAGRGVVVLEGRDARGRSLRATVRRPLHRVDRPLCDTHVALSLPYRARGDGQPRDDGAHDRISEVAEQALSALGGDGPHAVLVGHTTSAGRGVVHLVVDGLEQDPQVLRAVVAGWPGVRLAVTPDPGWRAVDPLLG